VGEVKDGGLLFYAGTPALQWAGRMAQLGAEERLFWLETPGLAAAATSTGERTQLEQAQRAYRDALDTRIDRIRREQGAEYVVMESGQDIDVGERVWSNEAFVIRRLGEPGLYVVAGAGGREPALP
jgi:hypothetical protein